MQQIGSALKRQEPVADPAQGESSARNVHELNVLARIVITTLRSPLGSAYNKISTAALRDSGTSWYAVGGGT